MKQETTNFRLVKLRTGIKLGGKPTADIDVEYLKLNWGVSCTVELLPYGVKVIAESEKVGLEEYIIPFESINWLQA